jgi:hypothetical protein
MTEWPVRVIAEVAFALGFAACLTDQKQMAVVYGVTGEGPRPPMAYVVLTAAIGALALATGVIALVTGSAAMLAMLTASTAGLWVIATARHMLASGSGRPSQGSTKTV